MKISIFVADAAQDYGGKFNALGAGWTRIGTPLPQFAILGLIDLDESEIDTPHDISISLCHLDGTAVQHPTPPGGDLLRLESRFTADRPSDLADYETVRMPFIAPIPAGMPIALGGYDLVAMGDGDPATQARYRFRVHPDS